eukprot:scaffold61334_cov55-Phaeocystis_antarctica.AAC.1
MQGHEVQLYAILRDGALNRYPKVQVGHESEMPSGGALSNPNDKALVTSLEDKMIEAYGTALVEVKCKAAGGKKVDLEFKMLRPMHVGALFAAVERYQVAELNLRRNQLGAAGGALVAAALKTNTTLTTLECAQLGRPSNKVPRAGVLARMAHSHATLAALALFTFLCRVRSLLMNNLGPAAGMALAEALKGNTTLTSLESAAPSSNPLARASKALDMHPSFRAFHPRPPLLGRVSTPPRPRRERDQPFPACAPD